jgi:hypothetical protein
MATLVKHTKKRVRKLDNDVYAKMKKIFYLDATNQGSLSSSSSEVTKTFDLNVLNNF